jgi:sulfopyruvate decarboxylase subunit beta
MRKRQGSLCPANRRSLLRRCRMILPVLSQNRLKRFLWPKFRQLTDEIVVTTYSSAVDWLALGERALNYFSVGAMGLDSSHALGLALGGPDRRVICLQGDGSLLMNLGCLVTIAAAAPKNLVHLVVQNGTYEANGGHPIPNPKINFATMARAAGYPHAHEFSNLAIFEQQAGQVLRQEGPVFATLHVERSQQPLTYDYPKLYDPARRQALKAALMRQ